MNFTDVLEEQNIEYASAGHSHYREGWINFDCPYCDRGSGFRMGYNIAGRYCSCWNCGYHGVLAVLALLTGNKHVWDIFSQLPEKEPICQRRTKGTLKLPPGVVGMYNFHRDYLRERGLSSREITTKWEISGTANTSGRLNWRLFIPIHYRGDVVSWTTRSIVKDKQPRYISARDEESEMPISELLYGVDHVRNTVIVVEGPIDVWAIGYGAVALMGQNVSAAQMEQLSRVPNRLICFDNEESAQKRARKLAGDLSVFAGQTQILCLETGKDAAEASKEEILKLREEFLE